MVFMRPPSIVDTCFCKISESLRAINAALPKKSVRITCKVNITKEQAICFLAAPKILDKTYKLIVAFALFRRIKFKSM